MSNAYNIKSKGYKKIVTFDVRHFKNVEGVTAIGAFGGLNAI